MGGRYRISDEAWEKIRPFVDTRKSKNGRPRADARNLVDAIMWIMKTGAAWRDLPESEYGKWKTAYNNFLRWRNEGMWQKVLSALIEKSEAESVVKNDTYMIDSTSSKLHFDGNGAKKGLKITSAGQREG